MRFVYGKQDWVTRERGQENVYLLTNGLGGFSSASMINSNVRNDQALLMACLRAPNLRCNMVNRLEECLDGVHLSSQEFAGGDQDEEGYRYLNSFVFEDYPEWTFQVGGVEAVKTIAMAPGKNLVAVQYRLENHTDREAVLTVVPHLQFVPKGKELTGSPKFAVRECAEGEPEARGGTGGAYEKRPARECLYEILSGDLRLYFRTGGTVEAFPQEFCEGAMYACDARDGRNFLGRTCRLFRIRQTVPARGSAVLEFLCGMEKEIPESAEAVFAEMTGYRRGLERAAKRTEHSGLPEMPAPRSEEISAGLRSEAALQLAVSAGQFIARRESTGGSTILAGYPFFEDWGRDTMIALEGCCMTTGQFETAKSILRTFAGYCSRGLMPNLFPEGGQEPRYNTADAALLFINSVYAYYRRTGDGGFVREMWPVMTEIINAYRTGTDFGIGMDEDGLIRAGQGYDQVTWMDVRIENYLPTPRHGKPVEINAYWYNGLRVMEELGGRLSENSCGNAARDDKAADCGYENFARSCGRLAEKVRSSFQRKFWMEKEGRLRDVLSGTRADEQFRCNQIWAVSMPFSMLDRQQQRRIVDAVYEKLYTPYGLRTLEPGDTEFHGEYSGSMQKRDMAYHQGTVWVFPLGAYYLAYLKTRDDKAEAVRTVRRQIQALESAMREGCIGQLPEIYDGASPTFSRGCFAQAWSVGEILRVYEVLDRYE